MDALAASPEETAAANELLSTMRWSAKELQNLRLMAGHSRWIRGRGVQFLYVVDGPVVMRPSAPDVPDPIDPPPTESLTLRAGDFVLLPRGGDHELRADPVNGARLVAGELTLDAAPFERVTEIMPAVLFTCGFRVDESGFGGLLDMIDMEIDRSRHGTSAVLDRLIDLVVSAALRAWLERGCDRASAWLTQLRDPRLGRALEAIHSEPGSPWTVESLARVANASRSQFAEVFRTVVGESPARYVTRVRMQRAEELLSAGRPVSQVAFSLGYDSDEGFRRAFRRHSGSAPRDWRREVGASA